ncbi:MAG: hypothetical protein EP330_21490 [Deltaproteobacteria bacterium]|nr:MAG: hypothetical protein EP330_21490 [Deltaproteobacteria bacterium]
MRALGFLLLAACNGGGNIEGVLESAAVESAEIDVLDGSGAQQRFRVTLAEASGAALPHDGVAFVLWARATDPAGQDSPGLFSIDLTIDTDLVSNTELVTPGTHEFRAEAIAAGTCEPGCFTEVDLTWVHVEGGDAKVSVEARAEVTVEEPDLELLFDVEAVF